MASLKYSRLIIDTFPLECVRYGQMNFRKIVLRRGDSHTSQYEEGDLLKKIYMQKTTPKELDPFSFDTGDDLQNRFNGFWSTKRHRLRDKLEWQHYRGKRLLPIPIQMWTRLTRAEDVVT